MDGSDICVVESESGRQGGWRDKSPVYQSVEWVLCEGSVYSLCILGKVSAEMNVGPHGLWEQVPRRDTVLTKNTRIKRTFESLPTRNVLNKGAISFR
jgi:hypothetical protein